MRTEVAVTDSHGHASVHGLQLNRAAGRFQIRIVASKEQARAGMVSFQYIAEPGSGAGPGGHPATAGSSHGYRKWIVVALLVGGGRRRESWSREGRGAPRRQRRCPHQLR